MPPINISSLILVLRAQWRTLLIILGIAVLLVGIGIVLKLRKQTRQLPEFLVQVDTSQIAYIELLPGSRDADSIYLRRAGNQWLIRVLDTIWKPALASYVRSNLATFAELKPLYIASTDEKQWSQFGVDTQGLRVRLYDHDHQLLADFIVGTYHFQPGATITYIRLPEDPTVYAIGKFLEVGLSPKISQWRESILIRDQWQKWHTLELICSGTPILIQYDSTARAWKLNNQQTIDSTLIARFLPKFTFLRGNDFVDTLTTKQLGNPILTLRIHGTQQGITELQLYTTPDHHILVTSSLQPQDVLQTIEPPNRIHNIIQELFDSLGYANPCPFPFTTATTTTETSTQSENNPA